MRRLLFVVTAALLCAPTGVDAQHRHIHAGPGAAATTPQASDSSQASMQSMMQSMMARMQAMHEMVQGMHQMMQGMHAQDGGMRGMGGMQNGTPDGAPSQAAAHGGMACMQWAPADAPPPAVAAPSPDG